MDDSAVLDFEEALADYTGATYVVAVKRCCIALKGCCEYLGVKLVFLPKHTYEFVPASLVRSGVIINFDDRSWSGGYSLDPYPIWDYARRFQPGMYVRGQYQCLSFHRSKILGYTEGGAVLTDDPRAVEWLRQWRDDGRKRSGRYDMIGESGLMYPEIALALDKKLHWRRTFYDEHFGPHPDLPNSDYPDLSKTDWNGLWTKQLNRQGA